MGVAMSSVWDVLRTCAPSIRTQDDREVGTYLVSYMRTQGPTLHPWGVHQLTGVVGSSLLSQFLLLLIFFVSISLRAISC